MKDIIISSGHCPMALLIAMLLLAAALPLRAASAKAGASVPGADDFVGPFPVGPM